jgi:hypothetical protein
MDRFVPSGQFALRLAVVLAISIVALPLLIPVFGVGPLSAEGGFMEDVQALTLAVAAVLFLVAAWRSDAAPRLAFYLLGIACIVMVLRELEFSPTGPVGAYLESEAFRLHEAVAVGLAVLPYAFLARRHIAELARFVVSLACWPLYLACLFIVAGEAVDKFGQATLGGPAAQFIEELAENCAFLILLAMAILTLVRSGPSARDYAADRSVP